jgi:sugar lactone lactonase YvrE
MRTLLRQMLVCMFFCQLYYFCFAQTEIITTYAGIGLLRNGALATTQAIHSPQSVVSDGAGGFYIACFYQSTVYRVSEDGKIRLIAGNGRNGYSGDSGLATSAQLYNPAGLAIDSVGNLFFADFSSSRIRKISTSGIITTVAGNGSIGFSGDGGPATSAQLNYPRGVAVDSAGNLFIADMVNNIIRKVSPSGIISTLAGKAVEGIGGFAGYSGDEGPATSALLYYPSAVTTDSDGNLFIADRGNLRIRKVSPSGIITTVAGNGSEGYGGDGGPATSAQLKSPYGMAVDSAGDLFILDSDNHCIRKVSSGIITTVAGNGSKGYGGDGGPATSAQLNKPLGAALDSSGNLYIADSENCRVRKVSSSGIITTVAGNGFVTFSGDGGPAVLAQLKNPIAVAVDTAGNLFITDEANRRIRKVSASGIITTVAGNGNWGISGDGGPATSAMLTPFGIAVDSAGNLFIVDNNAYRIRKVSASGIITTVVGYGYSGFKGDGGPATSAQLQNPFGLAVDSAGNLFIADTMNRRIRKVSSGIITTVVGNGMQGNGGDGGPATSAQLNYPVGVAVDSTGNLFIADAWCPCIRKVSPSGIITTVAGNGSTGYGGDGGPATSAQLQSPFGIAVDTAGNLFIADTDGHRIRQVSSSGIITTIAGTGISGYSGDGRSAASAQLYSPYGVAVDAAGNLFIADLYNDRVRKVIKPKASIDLDLSAGGAGQASTIGANQTAYPGYATVDVKSGAAPYGTAVFSFKQDGVTVSEAGVPASPPTVSARVFVDYRTGVNALPARSDAGVVDVNTGIAVVNYGAGIANVAYTLRAASGSIIATGHGTLDAGKHFSCFIDQLKDVAASDFNLPADFKTALQFGALDITSDQPLSVLSLRGTLNQRRQFIITTTPVADLTQSTDNNPMYIAQFADGGGYTTSLILMNASAAIETGTIQIMDNNGAPLVVHSVEGSSGSSFPYSIPPNGIYRFQTDGSPADGKAGWVTLAPDSGASRPVGAGIFGYNPGNVLVTESGVPMTSATTHARVYVDRSGNHNTGLAVANISEASAAITIRAYQTDGITAAGTSVGPLTLAAYGHDSKFADQYIAGLPDEFTGILDVSSTAPFAALTVRALYNENDDFLMTTFPVADGNQTAPSPIVFPQIADGGGYETQFILISTGDASSATIHYYGNDGAPLAVGR